MSSREKTNTECLSSISEMKSEWRFSHQWIAAAASRRYTIGKESNKLEQDLSSLLRVVMVVIEDEGK